MKINEPGRPPEKETKFEDLDDRRKMLLLYNEGCGDIEVCKGLEISKEDFDERLKTDNLFKKLVSFGRTLAQAWWEELGRKGVQQKGLVDASIYNFQMKNRFGWAEKSETNDNSWRDLENMTKDEVQQKIRELGPKILDFVEAKQNKK